MIDANKELNQMRYIKYDKEEFIRKEISSVDEFLDDVDSEKVRWLDIIGLSDNNILDGIYDKFKIHPLAMEDILNMDQSPKVVDYDEGLFIIAKNIILGEELLQEQISFMVYQDKLISFRRQDTKIFDEVEERLKEGTVLRKNGVDDLLYALLDLIVDRYFDVMKSIGDKLDELEDRILENPDESILEKVYLLKRDFIFIRSILWGMRNTVNSIAKNEYDIINGNTIYYFRDIYDRIIQIIDINETHREIASSMLEIYLSSIGNKTNDVMKILTIYSTIFIPLTFLAGIYGMNFRYMPELYWKYGYISFWVISIAITIYIIRFFRKKGWM